MGQGTEAVDGLDVLVDGVSTTETAQDPSAPIYVAPGRHVVDVRARFAGTGGVSVSSVEHVDVEGASAHLRITLASLPGEMRPERRIEVRFSGEHVTLVGGSLPVVLARVPGSIEGGGPAPVLAPGEPLALDLPRTDTMIEGMRAMESKVRARLAAARYERDVVKTLCESDKLSQISVAIRSASERRASLAEAIAAGDADHVAHESTVVRVVDQRIRQLLSESDQCVGEETQVTEQRGAAMPR